MFNKPYECEVCLLGGTWKKKLDKALTKRSGEGLTVKEQSELETKIRKYRRAVEAFARHERQLETQRAYVKALDAWLHESLKRCVIYLDFGAFYDIRGDKCVDLVFSVRYVDDYGHIDLKYLHNFCTNPDMISEDSFYVVEVWKHHLQNSGQFDRWNELVISRDNGGHLHNNKVSWFESTITTLTGKKIEVHSLAKRHGYNLSDGAISRVASVSRNGLL